MEHFRSYNILVIPVEIVISLLNIFSNTLSPFPSIFLFSSKNTRFPLNQQTFVILKKKLYGSTGMSWKSTHLFFIYLGMMRWTVHN